PALLKVTVVARAPPPNARELDPSPFAFEMVINPSTISSEGDIPVLSPLKTRLPDPVLVMESELTAVIAPLKTRSPVPALIMEPVNATFPDNVSVAPETQSLVN